MITKRTQFYFIRHGETDANRNHIFAGSTDVPLNQTGRVQAHAAAQVLKNHHFKTIVSSPLVRAHETARIIGEYVGLQPIIVDELQELCVGVLEGQPISNSPWSEFIDQWKNGNTIEGFEPYHTFTQRVAAGVNKALMFEGPVLVVAHGAVGSILLNEILGHGHVIIDNATPHSVEPHDEHETAWRFVRLGLTSSSDHQT